MNSLIVVAQAGELMKGRIFDLDPQFIADSCILAVAVFVLFTLLSYLLFNPARELLKKRQEKIQNDINVAIQEKESAKVYKMEYDSKLKNVEKEAQEILSDTRKKALKKENEIVNEAKEEAAKILQRAEKEAELEKSKAKDEVKKEMVEIASLMAGKIVSASIDERTQEDLIEETLKEMGDSTWQN